MQHSQQTPAQIAAELAANTEHNRRHPLFAQDQNVRKQGVYPNLARDVLCQFSLICTKAAAETLHQRLLHAAVGAEPESYGQESETNLAAIAILKKHPELLFATGTVTDHVGRKIVASPYQLFHGAGDVWALKQIHAGIIPHIANGEARAQEQFHQQFPNCKLPFDASMGEAVLYDVRNIALLEQVKENLKNIVAVITADPCTNGVATRPEAEAAVAALRQLFAPKEGEVIRTGLHFPLAIMREIFRVYTAQFAPWSTAQLSFFSREVIGAALAASTAVDGQCCKHGLSKLDVNKGPDRRDGLFCRHPKGVPSQLAPLSGKLGRTAFVDPAGGESCFLSYRPGVFDWYYKNGRRQGLGCGGYGLSRRDRGLESLCRAKTLVLGSLCSHAETREDVLVCNVIKNN